MQAYEVSNSKKTRNQYNMNKILLLVFSKMEKQTIFIAKKLQCDLSISCLLNPNLFYTLHHRI